MRLIDADALIEFIDIGHLRPPTELCFSELDVKNLVDKQPTIERKTGKWIKLDKDNKFFVPHMLKCSECGNTLDKHGVNAGRGDANYCPNCGADMRGEQP